MSQLLKITQKNSFFVLTALYKSALADKIAHNKIKKCNLYLFDISSPIF